MLIFPPRRGGLPSECASVAGCRRIVAQEIIVVVLVDAIAILTTNIVEPLEFAELQMCPTVKLASSIFSKTFAHTIE